MQKKKYLLLLALIILVSLFYFPNSPVCSKYYISNKSKINLKYGHTVTYALLAFNTDISQIYLISGKNQVKLSDFPASSISQNKFGKKIFLDKFFLTSNNLNTSNLSVITNNTKVELIKCQTVAPLSVLYNSVFYSDSLSN
jgi:hypothetical protein